MGDSTTAPQNLWYRIDSEDRIIVLSPDWLGFASENGAPQLDAEHVVGRPIYHFIADPETRHLYGAVFEKVRRSGEVVRLPFRCDSPASRRLMEITIRQASPEGALELSTELLKLESRPSPLRLLEHRSGTPTRLNICSWCEKIEYLEKKWIDVDKAVTELDLFNTAPLPALFPSVCPNCTASIRKRLQLPAMGAQA